MKENGIHHEEDRPKLDQQSMQLYYFGAALQFLEDQINRAYHIVRPEEDPHKRILRDQGPVHLGHRLGKPQSLLDQARHAHLLGQMDQSRKEMEKVIAQLEEAKHVSRESLDREMTI